MKGYSKSHKMNINLNNSEEISKAIGKLSQTSNVVKATKEFMQTLIDDGVEYARDIVPVDTGDLRDGISGEVVASGTKITGKVIARSDHAAYVEYGTGVVGEGTYPADTNGYEYNVPSMWKDVTGGWYYGEDYRIYTHGHVANPFMFRTANEMRRRSVEIAKDVFDDNSK